VWSGAHIYQQPVLGNTSVLTQRYVRSLVMRDNDRCHCRYSEAVLSTYVIPGLQPGLQISCKRCLSDLLKSISMPPLTRPLPTGAALGRHRNAFLKPVSHPALLSRRCRKSWVTGEAARGAVPARVPALCSQRPEARTILQKSLDRLKSSEVSYKTSKKLSARLRSLAADLWCCCWGAVGCAV
jgi:hypothetical protein